MKTILKHKGFTLIEMMIYGAILMSFLVVLAGLFSSLIETQLSSESQSAIVQDGRFIFSRLSYDVGMATDIPLPASLGAVSSILQVTINGGLHTIALNNSNLEATDASGTYRLNSEGTTVSNLTFQKLGNPGGRPSVRLGFTLTGTILRPQGIESRSFQTTFSLR